VIIPIIPVRLQIVYPIEKKNARKYYKSDKETGKFFQINHFFLKRLYTVWKNDMMKRKYCGHGL